MPFRPVTLDQINAFNPNTLMDQLGIRCIEIGDDFLVASMPVDYRTMQPMGLLHGGASAALIESIGSMGSALLLDLSKYTPVGLEVNANHVGSVRTGEVHATGRIIHQGKRTHLWQVDIVDASTKKLVCTGRLTVMVIEK